MRFVCCERFATAGRGTALGMTTNSSSRPNTQTERFDRILQTYDASGPTMATVFLPAKSADAQAPERLEIHVKNALAALSDQGANEALIERVERALKQHEHSDAASLVVVATEQETLLDEEMDRPVTRMTTALQPVPMLLPLLAAAQVDEEHLAVLLDRTGADVFHRDGVGKPIDTAEVEGDDVRVHRGHPGGWSQRRFQQTAENAWENNAKDVVDAIVDEYGRDLHLVVAGDERAVGFFVEHLPTSMTRETVGGSRHADHAAFLDEVDNALRSRAANRVVVLLDRFRTANANGLGAVGHAVLDHLVAGRVEHLLVVNDALNEHPTTASMMLGDRSVDAPITDGAVALARTTGADITVVPAVPDLDDGLGAILRF